MSRPDESAIRYAIARLPVMVIALNAQGNIIAWNRECERVAGYRYGEEKDVQQVSATAFPDAAFRQGLLAKWQLRGDKHVEWVGEITAKTGESKTILWSIPPKSYRIPGWSAWVMGLEITTPST
ncbi:MAG TPA: hypothetical protein DCY27_13445 [Desulfobacterales bacterium]|nr:hypothetical protein [Desulfobacterales bacterium]